jgi:hypothetical protein
MVKLSRAKLSQTPMAFGIAENHEDSLTDFKWSKNRHGKEF